MSDALSPTSPDAPAPEAPGAEPALEAAFGMHVRTAPPLSWLAAAAAFLAMSINQVVLPAFNAPAHRALMLRVDRLGDFLTNLTAIAGLIAIGFGLFAFIRHSTVVRMRQRLLLASFSGMFLPTIAVATLFERQRTTAQIVLFALGAAHVLGAIVNSSAAGSARTRVARMAALVTATMAVLTLIAQVLQLTTRVNLSTWQVQLKTAASGAGELCYLVLLVLAVPLALPARAITRRDRMARLSAFFLLPLFLGGLYIAQRNLGSDFALLLYHAQRVSLFIDGYPLFYALPIGLACASVAGSIWTGDAIRNQAGAAIFLLLSSGYAPHAPVRLRTLALAMVLIARVVIAPSELAEPEKLPPSLS